QFRRTYGIAKANPDTKPWSPQAVNPSKVLLAPPRQHKQRPGTGPRSFTRQKSVPHVAHGAGADRSLIPVTLQQRVFDDRLHFAAQPSFKRQSKTALRAI